MQDAKAEYMVKFRIISNFQHIFFLKPHFKPRLFARPFPFSSDAEDRSIPVESAPESREIAGLSPVPQPASSTLFLQVQGCCNSSIFLITFACKDPRRSDRPLIGRLG